MILKDYLVFDIETSGLSPNYHKILELGVVVVNQDKVVQGGRKYVNAGVSVDSLITQITGITQEDVEGGEDLKSVLDWFQEQLEDYTLIGHNILRFDHPFLLNESKRIEHPISGVLRLNRLWDTAVMFKGWKLNLKQDNYPDYITYARYVLGRKVTGLKYNVKFICEELEIDMEGLSQHSALDDCILTSRIYQKMRDTIYA